MSVDPKAVFRLVEDDLRRAEERRTCLDPPEDRYRRDVSFRTMVDFIEDIINRCEYSPTEIREAAMLAVVHHELRTTRSYLVRET